jgi:hypothetical protein
MHMVHHRLAAGGELHAVFLDVSGAYDTVDHKQLVQCLEAEYQLPVTLVHVIVGMYTSLQYAVQYAGGHCPAFQVGVGVKQGCPLSPVLYALYVSGLRAWLKEHCPDVGFVGPSGEVLVRELFYADDITLVAEEYMGAQDCVTAAARYLVPKKQGLGVAKCGHMVFAREPLPCLDLEVDGQEIPTVHTAKLLGLQFDATATATTMVTHRAGVFASQFGVVVGGLRASCAHAAHSLLDFVYLLKVVAEAAGLYGCGLWGVFMCTPTLQALYAFDDPLERRRARLLRGHLRLPKDTPTWCLVHELGLRPFVHTYVLSAVKLYNALVQGGPMYQALLKHNLHDGLVRTPAVRNWAYHLHAVLALVHPRGRWRARMLAADLEVLPFGEVRAALRDTYNTAVEVLKRAQPGEVGSWRGWYFREVCTHPLGTQPVYLRRRFPYQQVVDCLRFRLGVHYLQVRVGRHLRPVVPRSRRYCLRCVPRRCVDDEGHCLYHCSYPPLQHARAAVAPVVQGLVCRNVADLFQAAGRRTGALRRVVRLLAVCYRVSRATREAPAPVGVDAPLIVSGDEDLDYVAFLSDSDDVEDLHELSDVYDDGSELEEVVLPEGIVLPASLYD